MAKNACIENKKKIITKSNKNRNSRKKKMTMYIYNKMLSKVMIVD